MGRDVHQDNLTSPVVETVPDKAQSIHSTVSSWEFIYFLQFYNITFQNMIEILVDDETRPCLILASEIPSMMGTYADQLAATYADSRNRDTLHCFRSSTIDHLTGWHRSFIADTTRLFVGPECLKPNLLYTSAYT